MKRIAGALVAVLLLAACTSATPDGGTNTTPGFGSGDATTTHGVTADDVAAAYDREADGWIADTKNTIKQLADYPKQLSVKQATAPELGAQKTYCSTAQRMLTNVKTPPVLDDAANAKASLTYQAAITRDKTLRTRAKAVEAQLDNLVRFCTWLDAFESGQPAAATVNATLFTQPLQYTGTIKVDGVSHTCPTGSSCYTPDQSLWPRISTLWQKQGTAIAQGANAIKDGHLPCLVRGWEAMCDLVVQNQLDYQKWADEYAQAFDDNKDKELKAANSAITAVAAKFNSEVLLGLSNLPGIYRQLAPHEKYDARVSTTGANIWIAHVTAVVKDLTKAADAL